MQDLAPEEGRMLAEPAMGAGLGGGRWVPSTCFPSASPTGNRGSRRKREQRHSECLQRNITVVMAFAADSPLDF